jgi:hypothetical protein
MFSTVGNGCADSNMAVVVTETVIATFHEASSGRCPVRELTPD